MIIKPPVNSCAVLPHEKIWVIIQFDDTGDVWRLVESEPDIGRAIHAIHNLKEWDKRIGHENTYKYIPASILNKEL